VRGNADRVRFDGGENKIRHVIYIIKENRTYDQVFGDLGFGDGDPPLTMYDLPENLQAFTKHVSEVARTLRRISTSWLVNSESSIISMIAATFPVMGTYGPLLPRFPITSIRLGRSATAAANIPTIPKTLCLGASRPKMRFPIPASLPVGISGEISPLTESRTGIMVSTSSAAGANPTAPGIQPTLDRSKRRPWLYRLTANVVLMAFRKKKLATDWIESPAETDDESGSIRHEIAVIDLQLSGLFDRINLQAAIEQLPEGYKAMFLLHDVYGYDHKAIAKMRGCSVGNTKSQLHKARKRLREELRGQDCGSE